MSTDRRWRLHARLRFNEALGRVVQARALVRAGMPLPVDGGAQP
jgi:hypothetical protein